VAWTGSGESLERQGQDAGGTGIGRAHAKASQSQPKLAKASQGPVEKYARSKQVVQRAALSLPAVMSAESTTSYRWPAQFQRARGVLTDRMSRFQLRAEQDVEVTYRHLRAPRITTASLFLPLTAALPWLNTYKYMEDTVRYSAHPYKIQSCVYCKITIFTMFAGVPCCSSDCSSDCTQQTFQRPPLARPISCLARSLHCLTESPQCSPPFLLVRGSEEWQKQKRRRHANQHY
jgi:hypothetical protein